MNVTTLLEGLITDLDREEEVLNARLEELRMERSGLNLALRRAQKSTPTGPTVFSAPAVHYTAAQPTAEVLTTPTNPVVNTTTHDVDVQADMWAGLNQAQMVTKILEEADRPLSNQDVARRLAELGRPQETRDAVRGTLGYLKRTGKANFAGRGQWYLIGSFVHRTIIEPAQDVDFPENAETPALAGAPDAESASDAAPTTLVEGGDDS